MAEGPLNIDFSDVQKPEVRETINARFGLLPSEYIIHIFKTNHNLYGNCYIILTNWAIYVNVHNTDSLYSDFALPYKCIFEIKKKGGRRRPGDYGIFITTTTTSTLFIPFDKKNDERPAFYKALIDASSSSSPLELPTSIYESDHSWIEELRISSGWNLIDNDFCPTYPAKLLVPPELPVEKVKLTAKFRSKGRIPYLSYIFPETGALLLRSSQPLTGITNSDCPADAEFIQSAIGERNFSIFDCRPKLNAVVNIFTGGGYESADSYDKAENQATTDFRFFNIPNIHRVRDCYIEMRSGLEDGSKMPWKSWGDLIIQLMRSAELTATSLHENRASLVHCTDGWDRTAQVSALAQILLDPAARTINGLRALIQKEWCDAGHMFGLRCAHQPVKKPDQAAPVFMQFLDAVFQYMQAAPSAFAFNQNLLLYIAFHAYSQLFGDFLGKSEREREATPRPPSMWEALSSPEFVTMISNPDYDPSTELTVRPEDYVFFAKLHCPPVFGGSFMKHNFLKSV